MKLSKMTLLFAVISFMLALSIAAKAQSWGRGPDDKDQEQKVKLLGTVLVPGNPFASTDIVSADQTTGLVFFADRSNAGVDVIDGTTDLFVGRITEGIGEVGGKIVVWNFEGLTSPSTHEGPNGVVSTPDKKVWAADGDSTVKVIDVDPSSPTYLQIVAVINTAGLTAISNCTGGTGTTTTGTCNRDDEIAYDPVDNIIMVNNDEPTGLPPFSTFIDASFPYTVLGQINYKAQGNVAGDGLEQPEWDPGLRRFLQTLPTVDSNDTGPGDIVVVNPKTELVEKVISLSGFDCSPSGLAVGQDEHVIVACGNTTGGASFPLVLDVTTGHELGEFIDEVGGGDEVNYNPGENEFIVSSNVEGIGTNPTVLGVINGKTGDWIQNAPAATGAGLAAGTGGLTNNGLTGTASLRAGNLAALGSNNHVFVIVHPAASPATDICDSFTVTIPSTITTTPVTKTLTADFGCVAVFGAVDNDDNHKGW